MHRPAMHTTAHEAPTAPHNQATSMHGRSAAAQQRTNLSDQVMQTDGKQKRLCFAANLTPTQGGALLSAICSHDCAWASAFPRQSQDAVPGRRAPCSGYPTQGLCPFRPVAWNGHWPSGLVLVGVPGFMAHRLHHLHAPRDRCICIRIANTLLLSSTLG